VAKVAKESRVAFNSDGLKLAGTLSVPKELQFGERRPAFIIMHGFGSNMECGSEVETSRMLNGLGYVTLRFDMRGCGLSEGERGRVICLEEVSDASNALTFLQEQPSVDPARIGMVGSSFGAAVSVYAGGVDKRVSAVISSGGWGNGERKFRGQHPTPEAWKKFADMLEKGKKHFAETGLSLMVDRYDIVPIPAGLRANLPPGSIERFPVETAQSMMEFMADDVIAQIAPRPVLLLHSSVDTVTPTEQSIEMFRRAKQPCDLHLFAETTHFMFAEGNQRVHTVVRDWLAKYFPVRAAAAAV
jgi:dipeptidyl aminopeptidase/acylaminoacyl peptidase